MLSKVRNSLSGITAWIFVILLIAAFSLFGVPQLSQFAGQNALSVGGQNYSAQYIQSEFSRAIERQRAESGGSFTREDAVANGLHDQVVSSIATGAALDLYAEKMRLVLPREMISGFLRESENFQNPATGRFDETVLRSILQRYNISVEEFERRIAADLTREQLVNALATRGPAPRAFADATLKREIEQRRIAYLTITDEMAGKPAEATPDDLQAYYDANPAAYTAPEYRTFELLVLRAEDFREGLETPEEELRKLYEINKARIYDKPERRTIYQLTYDTEAEAQAAVSALRQGKPFENVATERGLSLETATFTEATRNDILDTAVGDAAFSEDLQIGDTTDPVKSVFGWTIVQLAGITPPETRTFEEVREELESTFLEQDTRRRLLAAIDEIEDTRDSGAGLADAADAAELTVETVGPIDRYAFAPGGAIVDDFPAEVLSEVFELEEGEETEAIRLADESGYYFVALQEITPPALMPYEDVRDEVVAAWRKQERQERISATVQTIRDAIARGQTLEEAAAQFDRTPIEEVIDRRFENETISRAMNEKIFFAQLNENVSGPVALGNAHVIAEIREINFTQYAQIFPQLGAYEQYLGFQLDQELVEATIDAIQDDFGVKVNQAQLDQVFGENL
ncbi:MAG: hypothetical protein HKP25_08095 [Marinicaulis sp.]|nr:hypothetical protein [Marinicaulis sp.]